MTGMDSVVYFINNSCENYMENSEFKSVLDYVNSILPINTEEKVDMILDFVCNKSWYISKETELGIRMAIQKLKIQQYYQQEFEKRNIGFIDDRARQFIKETKKINKQKSIEKAKRRAEKEQKKLAKRSALVSMSLNAIKGQLTYANDDDRPKMQAGGIKLNGKRQKTKHKSKSEKNKFVSESWSGGRLVSKDSYNTMRNLKENDRDYSKPSLESKMTRELREKMNKRRPRIISIPMGGQKKRY